MALEFYRSLFLSDDHHIRKSRQAVYKLYLEILSKLWVNSQPSPVPYDLSDSLTTSMSFDQHDLMKQLPTRYQLSNYSLMERNYWSRCEHVKMLLLKITAYNWPLIQLASRHRDFPVDLHLISSFGELGHDRVHPSIMEKRLNLSRHRDTYDPWLRSLGVILAVEKHNTAASFREQFAI